MKHRDEPEYSLEHSTLPLPRVSMWLVSLISYIDRNTLALLSPAILTERLSAEQYGYIISAFSVAYMIGNPVWGYGCSTGSILACRGALGRLVLNVGLGCSACVRRRALEFRFRQGAVGLWRGSDIPRRVADCRTLAKRSAIPRHQLLL